MGSSYPSRRPDRGTRLGTPDPTALRPPAPDALLEVAEVALMHRASVPSEAASDPQPGKGGWEEFLTGKASLPRLLSSSLRGRSPPISRGSRERPRIVARPRQGIAFAP
jgi:hypothetical protein